MIRAYNTLEPCEENLSYLNKVGSVDTTILTEISKNTDPYLKLRY